MLAYKRNAEATTERLRQLYERSAGDRIFAEFEIPTRTLDQFRERRPASFCVYPDPHERARFWDALLCERSALEDDSMPAAYLSELDQGLYGGLLGGDVRFIAHPENGWVSSMVPPVLRELSDLKPPRLDASNPWWERYIAQLDLFRATAVGRFGISHFILIDSLNFVFELVGATRTYLLMLDDPELVQQAVGIAFEVNATIHHEFFRRVGTFSGGTFSNMVQWVPGRIVSESVDPFHMTSVEWFERWGRGPVEQIFSEFDGGVLHLHGNGRHLLEAVCTLRGLKAIQMGDDRGFEPSIDIVSELRARTGGVPLVVTVNYADFAHRLERHDLPGGVLYRVRSAPGAAAVNRLMEAVRAYRM